MFGIKKASRQEKEEKQKKENVNWSKVQAAKKGKDVNQKNMKNQ